MTDLVLWLRSQLDADEKVAKRAARMRYELPSDAPWESARIATERGVPSPSLPLIALGSPAHVLRTVAAHRAILDDLAELERFESDPSNDPATRAAYGACARAMDLAVRRIAAIYGDRPGFDPSWRADP